MGNLVDPIIAELEHEAVSTRKVLERIPASEFGWTPHPKSFTMGRLASHLAEIPGWATTAVTMDVFDMDPDTWQPWTAATTEELVAKFDKELEGAIAAMRGQTDEQLLSNWTMKIKGEPRFTMPKIVVLRGWVLKHIVHHRAQLSVYLRLRDIPVPSIYGPSADEGQL